MNTFLTGATGYLGGYTLNELLRDPQRRVTALVRATDRAQAVDKLWRGLQLHMGPDEFYATLERIDVVLGDLHAPDLGLDRSTWQRVVEATDDILHIAASLNRKSERACVNTNLRGTLSVLRLARAVQDAGGLRRYSHVSTVAVAGERLHESVSEDEAIDWDRRDYDPYGRTKKFCEHMARELLPDVDKTFFRPSIVLGDTRKPQTTQFDMVRAFAWLADLPWVPLPPEARLDIVPADYVGRAIAHLHRQAHTPHEIYHLSSGLDSPTVSEIGEALARDLGRRPMRFAPGLLTPFDFVVRGANRMPRGNPVQGIGALLKVFLPYLRYDTVFDNARVVEAMGQTPAPFVERAAELYTWAKQVDFAYPHVSLPTPTEAA